MRMSKVMSREVRRMLLIAHPVPVGGIEQAPANSTVSEQRRFNEPVGGSRGNASPQLPAPVRSGVNGCQPDLQPAEPDVSSLRISDALWAETQFILARADPPAAMGRRRVGRRRVPEAALSQRAVLGPNFPSLPADQLGLPQLPALAPKRGAQ